MTKLPNISNVSEKSRSIDHISIVCLEDNTNNSSVNETERQEQSNENVFLPPLKSTNFIEMEQNAENFSEENNMNNSSAHETEKQREKYTKCAICDCDFSEKKELVDHISAVHLKRKTKKQEKCIVDEQVSLDKYESESDDIDPEKHVENNLKNNQTTNILGMNPPIKCNHCKYTYATVDKFEQHQRTSYLKGCLKKVL